MDIHGFICFADDDMFKFGIRVKEGFSMLRCGEEYPHVFGGGYG